MLSTTWLDYANCILYGSYGSLAKDIVHLQRVHTEQQELLHKSHYISLQSIHSINSTGCRFSGIQTCFYYFRSYAYCNPNWPLFSSYCLPSFPCSQVIFVYLPLHSHWSHFRFLLFPCKCHNYSELPSGLSPFFWHISPFQQHTRTP